MLVRCLVPARGSPDRELQSKHDFMSFWREALPEVDIHVSGLRSGRLNKPVLLWFMPWYAVFKPGNSSR